MNVSDEIGSASLNHCKFGSAKLVRCEERVRKADVMQNTDVLPLASGIKETVKESFSRLVQEKKVECYERIRSGNNEQSFQIGASYFTETEWKKLLMGFDAAMDRLHGDDEEVKDLYDRAQKPFEDDAPQSIMDKGVAVYTDEMSPVERYNEFSGNRRQKVMELGLDYIDATKCTWEEFRCLCDKVVESMEYDACPLEEIGIAVDDETEEMDCLNYLRRWSEQEMERGNMVGFHMGKRLSGAIANYSMDMCGEGNYIEADGVRMKVRIMEDNTSLRPSYLGSAFALDGTGEIVSFDARYADDSTAEEPVIEIHSYGADGKPGNVYRVVLSQVDMRNATQLELFALCAHRDKQGIYNTKDRYGDGSYDLCRNLGLCSMASVEEFTGEKKDWVQAFYDKIEEIKRLLENATMDNLVKKYTIGNFSLTAKEWERILDKMEEYREEHLSDIEENRDVEENNDTQYTEDNGKTKDMEDKREI